MRNTIFSCHLKAYGFITLPTAATSPSVPRMFSVLDFCTRQSCQESSCCPQFFSSFGPHLLSLSCLVFELPPLWAAAFICSSALGKEKSSASENEQEENKEGFQVLCLCLGSLAAHGGIFPFLEEE